MFIFDHPTICKIRNCKKCKTKKDLQWKEKEISKEAITLAGEVRDALSDTGFLKKSYVGELPHHIGICDVLYPACELALLKIKRKGGKE